MTKNLIVLKPHSKLINTMQKFLKTGLLVWIPLILDPESQWCYNSGGLQSLCITRITKSLQVWKQRALHVFLSPFGDCLTSFQESLKAQGGFEKILKSRKNLTIHMPVKNYMYQQTWSETCPVTFETMEVEFTCMRYDLGKLHKLSYTQCIAAILTCTTFVDLTELNFKNCTQKVNTTIHFKGIYFIKARHN